VTVVIGVVTVAVVPVGVVTLTVVIGVLTVTVPPTVEIGSVGRETVGTTSVEGKSDGATVPVVDEGTDAGVASPVGPCVGVGAGLAVAPANVLR
jgi:hypothetical protein